MINYRTGESEADLRGILDLQKQNLRQNLSLEEITTQGFVTVQHSFEQLYNLNQTEKHVIAEYNGQVIAYLLAMTIISEHEVPVLRPMFERFKELIINNRGITSYNYLVVGQVCVAKEYRGKGVLFSCYKAYKDFYSANYDFAITEISSLNSRSLNAHKKIGFKEIDRYKDSSGIEWIVIVWDWN
ncbi:GNAT family N-acetyltransferase [Christiangramia crocea]|uniref:GNAT family N-acetyltransferase n=1 Tax=Christiangramia crocea TaxID=2904124 RepID=A0A9X1UWS2_9FLAO|nr:GNAT family N-acetyltransferase [Gramella crocea]MCG9970924.1 GNAT family N-acetyltransferase [Gramella crocea]